MLRSIFTWWNGATIGARFQIGRRAVLVGEDEFGNSYHEAKDTSDSYDGRKRTFFFTAYEYDTILDSALINTFVPVQPSSVFPLPAPTSPVMTMKPSLW